jgi:hypothetical protein
MTSRTSADVNACCVAIRGGFLERPGLRVTLLEAQDLWAIGPPVCERALHELVMEGFLARTIDDRYCQPDDTRCQA